MQYHGTAWPTRSRGRPGVGEVSLKRWGGCAVEDHLYMHHGLGFERLMERVTVSEGELMVRFALGAVPSNK